jgi:hypothetical protein
MRKDMAKIIVERPRRGGTAWMRPGRSHALTDDDGAPYRDALRAPVRTRDVRTKMLNENLAPLERYLGKQVGRPWRKVYAEISARLKPTSTVQQHVRDHLEDFVAVKTHMADGVVHAQPRFGGPRPLAQDWRPYFVHPRTGLLKRNPDGRR